MLTAFVFPAITVLLCVVAFVYYRKVRIVKERCRKDRAWAEIDLESLAHNVRVLKELLPNGCSFMGVVKANAYGHGDIEIARALNHIGVNAFAVATIGEGIRLRKHRIKGEILVLGYTDPIRASELARYRLTQTVADAGHARELNLARRKIAVHIKVDTGMHRLGEDAGHISDIADIFQMKHLYVRGLYTHLCAADGQGASDIHFTNEQLHRFFDLVKALQQKCIAVPKVHVQSSYGVLRYPDVHCDYARFGIALYGVKSFPEEDIIPALELRPILTLKARVTLVRKLSRGETMGYGRQFTALHDSTIAVLSIGYADGIPRSMSCGRGVVLIHGKPTPIIGRICMDQLMVDITGVEDVQRGDVATLIGRDGSSVILAEDVAARIGTITNELLSRLSKRIKRVYVRQVNKR